MKLEQINIQEIKTDHLDCFHLLNTINSEFVELTPIYVSSKLELYGFSLSVYESLKKREIKECLCIVVPGAYFPKFDLYLQNITSNVVFLYHKIREKFPSEKDISKCEFDRNQLDLMYFVDLDDQDEMDIKVIEEETAKIKKQFDVSIIMKTLEQNYLVQKFFDTNLDTIDYQYFKKITTKSFSPLDEMMREPRDEQFYKNHLYPVFTIRCYSLEEMTEVLKFCKIDTERAKTSRVNFKRVEKIFKK